VGNGDGVGGASGALPVPCERRPAPRRRVAPRPDRAGDAPPRRRGRHSGRLQCAAAGQCGAVVRTWAADSATSRGRRSSSRQTPPSCLQGRVGRTIGRRFLGFGGHYRQTPVDSRTRFTERLNPRKLKMKSTPQPFLNYAEGRDIGIKRRMSRELESKPRRRVAQPPSSLA